MSMKKPVGLGLLVAVAAVLAMAIAASSALATEITTATHNIQASSTETVFLPNNAFGEVGVVCKKTSGGTSTIPTAVAKSEFNKNKEKIGTFSTGPGSVNFNFTERPKFEECNAVSLPSKTAIAAATVATNETNGKWQLAGDQFQAASEANDQRVGLIGVPKAAATITIGSCVITVSPSESSVVAGAWTNGTNSTTAPSTVKVDSQIGTSVNAACAELGLTSVVAQFEATYSVKDTTSTATPVLIKR